MLRPHGIFDYKIEMGSTPTPSYPTDGLISRWTFDETLEDDYGSVDLTYIALGAASPTYADGKIGKCIYFAQNGGVYTDALHDYLKSYGTFSVSLLQIPKMKIKSFLN